MTHKSIPTHNRTEPDLTTGRILIVDDEPSLRLAFKYVLERQGHQVIVAEDGYLGLRNLKENGPFDLAILDIHMPEIDGVSLLKQSRELDPEKTVWEEVSGGEDEVTLGTRRVASRAYCSWFNFKGRDQQRKVVELSGGERNRVHLAKLLRTGANVLLLDEPTNDLDVDTLRALEDALLEFAGCVVVISHDRWFLDRIATHILAFEGESQVVWFQGNYQDYETDRRRRLGSAADRPHRIKYRRLTRA